MTRQGSRVAPPTAQRSRGALRGCPAVALMCSAASLASRNVRQEIMLAWRYDRPILPFLLEPTTFPDDVAYWLEERNGLRYWTGPARRGCRSWVGRWHVTVLPSACRPQRTPSSPALATSSSTFQATFLRQTVRHIGRDRELRELQVLIAQGRWDHADRARRHGQDPACPGSGPARCIRLPGWRLVRRPRATDGCWTP